MICWMPGALVAQPTLPKLKTSTDLYPVDLGDVFSSRAEFLGLGMGVCKIKEKTQRKIRFQRVEKYLYFGGHLRLSVYTVKEHNTISFGFTGKMIQKSTTGRGGERRGKGPELLFHGVCAPPAGEAETCPSRMGMLCS